MLYTLDFLLLLEGSCRTNHLPDRLRCSIHQAPLQAGMVHVQGSLFSVVHADIESEI